MSYLTPLRIVTLGLAVTCSTVVRAQALVHQEVSSNPSVTTLNEEGAALYEQRDYRRAVERFLRAYALDPDPNLLFNIARCYEKLGDREAAVEKYEEFLSLPGADTRGKSRAHQSLAALRQFSAAEQARERAAQNPPNANAPNDTSSEYADTANSSPNESSSSNVWPWLALAAGVGAAGVGATFLVLGQRDHNQLIEAPGYDNRTQVFPFTESAAKELVESGDRKKLVGTIALSAGGALLMTSVVLFLLSGNDVDAPSVGLTVTPTTASLTFAGAF